VRCPRCGTEGVDAAGYCVGCRLYRGPGPAPAAASTPPPQSPAGPPPQPQPQSPPQPQPAPPTAQFQSPQPQPQSPPQPQSAPPAAQFQSPVPPPHSGPPMAQYPPGFGPPPAPARRNPLLIPGIIFGVVCILLVGAVIVYAATSGGGGDDSPAAGSNPVVATSVTGTPLVPSPTDEPASTAGASPGSGASESAAPSAGPSTPPCILGVWLEEKHDEQVTVVNTGTFLFSGSGTYHRYSDTGRVVFDYSDGMRLTGTNGGTRFEYVFEGFISYQYKIEGDVITFSSPRPSGTETFIRNGRTDYKGALEARVPQPMRINCGSVAMSLTSGVATIQLKRTSAAR
jgi:hypothetical protein